jgi:hypothetical protein
LACFGLHFLLLLAVSCRETLSIIARGLTLLPPSFNDVAQSGERIASGALAQGLATSNPLRQAIATYTNTAGIEAGYAFFAPGVSHNYKLVFEIHYRDNSIEYEAPQVVAGAAELRLASLLDALGRREYDPLREPLLRMLAYSVWRDHRDAVMIRALLGTVIPPRLREFEQGKKAAFEFLYAYDFTLPESSDADAR